MFNKLILTVALSIATVAAVFSVYGIGKLFGASIAVMIMASALEIGKIVTASLLTRKWSILPIPFKIYFSIALIILVLITSGGIYGFLTAAYQTTSDELAVIEQQVDVLTLKRGRYEDQITAATQNREYLNTRVNELTSGLSNNVIQYRDTVTNEIITSTSYATRIALQNELDDAREQRTIILQNIEEANDSLTSLDLQILDIRTNDNIAAEVGPLRYLSRLTGWSMDSIVNIFALMIIFVFDPLAISLVIGYNYLSVKESIDKTKLYQIYDEPKKTEEDDQQITTDESEKELPEQVVQENIETFEDETLDKPTPEPLSLEHDGIQDQYKMGAQAVHFK